MDLEPHRPRSIAVVKDDAFGMDSHGGWIASSTELVQFLNHVAGAPGIPALLKPDTIKLITAPAPTCPEGDARCARGWMVRNNGAGNWWRNGSLPGTTSILFRTPTGFCWARPINTRTEPPTKSTPPSTK